LGCWARLGRRACPGCRAYPCWAYPGRRAHPGCQARSSRLACLDHLVRLSRHSCRGRRASLGLLTYSGRRVCPVHWAYPTDNNIF